MSPSQCFATLGNALQGAVLEYQRCAKRRKSSAWDCMLQERAKALNVATNKLETLGPIILIVNTFWCTIYILALPIGTVCH